MKKNINLILVFVLMGILMLGFQNCSQARFSSTEIAANPTLNGLRHDKSTSFTVTESKNAKADILFVIDNSGSMGDEQAKIAQIFSGFISQVSHMDWRIAITTTDTSSSDIACNKGNLCLMESAQYFIDANTPNVNQVFTDKIQVGTFGSASELGLTAVSHFLTNKKEDYRSFMRPEATFVTIMVTDSEETSSLTAVQFLENAKAQLPQGKKYVSHSSIVLPGDSACKAINSVENKYAFKYHDVTVATGGILASICDENYGSQFQLIADTTVGKVAQQVLDCAPTSLVIVGPQGEISSGFEISGSKVLFNPALENPGAYQISYSCAQ